MTKGIQGGLRIYEAAYIHHPTEWSLHVTYFTVIVCYFHREKLCLLVGALKCGLMIYDKILSISL